MPVDQECPISPLSFILVERESCLMIAMTWHPRVTLVSQSVNPAEHDGYSPSPDGIWILLPAKKHKKSKNVPINGSKILRYIYLCLLLELSVCRPWLGPKPRLLLPPKSLARPGPRPLQPPGPRPLPGPVPLPGRGRPEGRGNPEPVKLRIS